MGTNTYDTYSTKKKPNNAIRVVQYDIEYNEKIDEYESIVAAAEDNGLKAHQIKYAIKKKGGIVEGTHWKWIVINK